MRVGVQAGVEQGGRNGVLCGMAACGLALGGGFM